MAFPRAKRFQKVVKEESPGPSSYSPKSAKDLSNSAKTVSSLYRSDRFKYNSRYFSNLDNYVESKQRSSSVNSPSSDGVRESSLTWKRGRARSRCTDHKRRSKSVSSLQTPTLQDEHFHRSFLEIKLEDCQRELATLKVKLQNLRFENDDLKMELSKKSAYINHLCQHGSKIFSSLQP